MGVILTGMGRDGADGLRELLQSGATTIGQDRKSSIVYGMPRAAKEVGALTQQVHLAQISDEVLALCQNR